MTTFVARHDIASILRRPHPELAVAELLAAALDADGPDNVTCVLVDIG